MQYTITEYISEYIKSKLNKKDYYLNDIYILIAYYLKISKNELYLKKDSIIIDENMKQELDKLLNKMYTEEIPLQYITHNQFFYNEKYFVNENVLIPRQDTEVLVERAIWYIRKYNLKSLLDMCTGSGCVGISIANNSNIENITLVDISKKALEVANRNIELNKVKKQIELISSDLFSNLKDKKYDIIVSNPPYIKTEDIESLDEMVKKEPHIALDGGKNGMDIYIRILKDAKKFLNNKAILMFEIGFDELDDIKNIIMQHKEYKIVECIKDLANKDRVVVCQYNH